MVSQVGKGECWAAEGKRQRSAGAMYSCNGQCPLSDCGQTRSPLAAARPAQAHAGAAPIFSAPDRSMVRLSIWRHRVWQPAAEKIGLPATTTPYALRHTAASLMAQQGVPVSTAAAALGHDPAIFLRTYAHLYPGDLRTAADAMDSARSSVRRGSKSPTRLPARRSGDTSGPDNDNDNGNDDNAAGGGGGSAADLSRVNSAWMGTSTRNPQAPASA